MMLITKRFLKKTRFLLAGFFAVSSLARAHEGHEQMMQMDTSHMNHAQHQAKTET